MLTGMAGGPAAAAEAVGAAFCELQPASASAAKDAVTARRLERKGFLL
jgi:hypothetical protein